MAIYFRRGNKNSATNSPLSLQTSNANRIITLLFACFLLVRQEKGKIHSALITRTAMNFDGPLRQWSLLHQRDAVNEYIALMPGAPVPSFSEKYCHSYVQLNNISLQILLGNSPVLVQRAIGIVVNFCSLFPSATWEQRRFLWSRLKSLIRAKKDVWGLPPHFVSMVGCGNPDQVRWFLFNIVFYEMTAIFRSVSRN